MRRKEDGEDKEGRRRRKEDEEDKEGRRRKGRMRRKEK